MKIYPVINVSQIVRYREPVKEQKVKKAKLSKVKEVEEWEVKKMLNKQIKKKSGIQ